MIPETRQLSDFAPQRRYFRLVHSFGKSAQALTLDICHKEKARIYTLIDRERLGHRYSKPLSASQRVDLGGEHIYFRGHARYIRVGRDLQHDPSYVRIDIEDRIIHSFTASLDRGGRYVQAFVCERRRKLRVKFARQHY